jgi:hypothetical protein
VSGALLKRTVRERISPLSSCARRWPPAAPEATLDGGPGARSEASTPGRHRRRGPRGHPKERLGLEQFAGAREQSFARIEARIFDDLFQKRAQHATNIRSGFEPELFDQRAAVEG